MALPEEQSVAAGRKHMASVTSHTHSRSNTITDLEERKRKYYTPWGHR